MLQVTYVKSDCRNLLKNKKILNICIKCMIKKKLHCVSFFFFLIGYIMYKNKTPGYCIESIITFIWVYFSMALSKTKLFEMFTHYLLKYSIDDVKILSLFGHYLP